MSTHKPQSSCFSPYYTYVQSPLCDFLVSFLPTWLAPNLITVSGFLILVSTHLLMLYLYGTSTEGPFDSWFCMYLGIAYKVYATLDNIDGKQARRTKSGSPMGMLFDHGCDAMTAVNFNIVIQRMMQTGGGTIAMLSMLISTLPFYALSFEEFYTGVLVMPAFTGPDDAALSVFVLACITAYYGS